MSRKVSSVPAYPVVDLSVYVKGTRCASGNTTSTS